MARLRAKQKATRERTPVRTKIKGALKTVFGKGKTNATTKVATTTAKPLATKAAKNPAKPTIAKQGQKNKKQAKAEAKEARALAKHAKALAKAQAKAKAYEAKNPSAAERQAKKEAKAKEQDANRVIPKTKDPIHQKLKDPNFFGEKNPAKDNISVESLGGKADALKQLKEPGDQFFSGDVGRLMAARLINRSSRNDADFRYSYGQAAFKNFAKADAVLNKIPTGQLANRLDVALLTKLNKISFTEGGDTLAARVGKGLRNIFVPGAKTKAGDLRNYQNYHFESKGLTPTEAKNITENGARYVKLPFLNKGFIVYANPATVKRGLDALLTETRTRLKDPSADPIKTASRFVQRFIALHPYADGNGRTARLVMDRILAERGMLPPILKNTGNDIGLSEANFAKEVLQGVDRTNTHFRSSGLRNMAGFVDRAMSQQGHTIAGINSQKLAKFDGLSYGLRKDGFVYNSAGRPHMADKNGDLRPLSQMTLYILMRRVSLQKNAPDILQQITGPTRLAFDKLTSAKSKGTGPKVLSDAGAIKSDGRLAVNLDGVSNSMLISLLNPKNISTKNLFPVKPGASALTTIMSRYQQADLELWYVKEAFTAKGDKSSVAKIEKHRDVLFERSRVELRSHIKKGSKGDDDNPLGAQHEYERIQHQYSPLRYAKRSDYTKKHGDSDAFVFRGENFAKWTGVHIDARPFRPGLKDAAGMRAKKQGALNLFDALKAVEGDTVGTGVQSYTTDLALLARKGGFADKHSSMKMNLAGMPAWGKAIVNMRIKDGESIEVSKNTGLLSALFSRRTATRVGHFSIKDIAKSDLSTVVKESAPADKVEALTKRIGEAQAKVAKKGFFKTALGLFRGPRLEVKADDILDAGQLKSFNTALGRTRNLVTAHRDGDAINVTAHRRANVFKVQKKHMLPGIDSLGGTFVAEQEVHVMASVLPHRILGTFTQKELSTPLGAEAKAEAAAKPATFAKPVTATKPATIAQTTQNPAMTVTPLPPAAGAM